jgi:hypothetical protein
MKRTSADWGGEMLDFTMRTHGKEHVKIIKSTSSIEVLKISPSRPGNNGDFRVLSAN